MRISLPALAVALAGLSPAMAQDGERFTLERTPDGYVRMDRRTGTMSICTEKAGELVCRLAADDREAYASELDRMSARLDQLERRLSALEGLPAAQQALPSDETVDQALGIMERFFRRFFAIVKDIERDEPAPREPAPAPSRT